LAFAIFLKNVLRKSGLNNKLVGFIMPTRQTKGASVPVPGGKYKKAGTTGTS
jgi:hypothetical protein